jgi:hypothetical protein
MASKRDIQRSRDLLLIAIAEGLEILLMQPIYSFDGRINIIKTSNAAMKSGALKGSREYFMKQIDYRG